MIPLPSLSLGLGGTGGNGGNAAPISFAPVFLNASGTGASGNATTGISWTKILIGAGVAFLAWRWWKNRR